MFLETPFPGNVVVPRKKMPGRGDRARSRLETRDEGTPFTMFANNQKATSVPDPCGIPLTLVGITPKPNRLG
jgi:hypothetical protein